MQLNFCIIGLGANLKQPIQQLNRACETLNQAVFIKELKVSSYYSSTPMGPQDQPDYVNAVAQFYTPLTAHTLLDELQKIELEQGRERTQHWGPRTLDLDILFFNQISIQDERLTIPHPGILQREFVVVPLAELSPDFLLPNGKQAKAYAQLIPHNGLKRI